MTRALLLGLFAILLAACGDEEPDCGRIIDSFTAVDTRIGGDCPPSPRDDDPYAIQIFDNDDGTVEIVIEGLNGSCTGSLEACDVVAACIIGTQPDPAATVNQDYTLTPDGLEGEVSVRFGPGVRNDAPQGCTARVRTVATR